MCVTFLFKEGTSTKGKSRKAALFGPSEKLLKFRTLEMVDIFMVKISKQ